ncbi:hypothetical protein GN958_ATG03755 [Phytophthora infestans]|uniref:Uncharacterized protein n=1 Tax=Phytophthora infestans TaxID=4787 RepID=A0A8S9V101_PHYIN|nr:hypothetical protein GN958_ATG03755 [Phytophthora infestans]
MYQLECQTVARATTVWRTSGERTSGSRLTDLKKQFKNAARELAQPSGFQLFVKSFSSKANDSGNAKYVCKKLNGQQFFDKNTSYDEIECPFAINVNGADGSWKVTRINLLTTTSCVWESQNNL